MFQGFKRLYYALKYGRKTKQMEAAYTFSLENSIFLCKHCRQELGLLHEIKIEDFLQHMENKHSEVVDMKQVEKFKTLFKFLRK